MRQLVLLLLLLPLALGQAGAPSDSSSATQPAAKKLDYYAMTFEEFFKRPEVKGRITQNVINIPLMEAAIFHETNRQRVALHLPQFKHSWALQLMARDHSEEMATLQYFAHESPTPANKMLGDRARQVGLGRMDIGENIAVQPAMEMGSGTYRLTIFPNGQQIKRDVKTGKIIQFNGYQELAESFLDQWMNSPPHRKNLESPRYRYLGIGASRGPYTESKQDSIYATQNFSSAITDTEATAQEQLQSPATRPAGR